MSLEELDMLYTALIQCLAHIVNNNAVFVIEKEKREANELSSNINLPSFINTFQ